MAELLEQLARKGAEGDFIHRALASAETGGAFAPAREILAATPSTAPARGVQAAPARAGTTPGDLTNREFDILEMLVQRLQNKEIASRLVISTHTVNYHLKHIYQKLGVSNRRQAVAEAVKIGIVPPS